LFNIRSDWEGTGRLAITDLQIFNHPVENGTSIVQQWGIVEVSTRSKAPGWLAITTPKLFGHPRLETKELSEMANLTVLITPGGNRQVD